jgi:pilus assembly protein TadC
MTAGTLSWVLLAVAALLAPGRFRRPPSVAPPDDRRLTLVLDLAAAALRSGRPLAAALALAAPAASEPLARLLDRVAALDRLGADAEQAWSELPRDGPLGEVARVAVRSASSGLKLAAGFERQAAEIRAAQTARALVRAHHAAVRGVAPLAACFLPSFACLGVLPVILGVAGQVRATFP